MSKLGMLFFDFSFYFIISITQYLGLYLIRKLISLLLKIKKL